MSYRYNDIEFLSSKIDLNVFTTGLRWRDIITFKAMTLSRIIQFRILWAFMIKDAYGLKLLGLKISSSTNRRSKYYK
jgi:hypothetical protein